MLKTSTSLLFLSRLLIGLVAFTAWCQHATAAPSDQPQIFWTSDPAQPNDTVLVAGAALENVTVARIGRVRDSPATTSPTLATAQAEPAVEHWQDVKPLQVTPRSVKFVIPAAWKNGVFACRLMAGTVLSRTFLLNAPTPWWMQADGGDTATPGGWVRVFGKSLSFGSPAEALLKTPTAKVAILKAAHTDGYALSFPLPATLQPGQYALYVHNGFGADTGWVAAGTLVVKAAEPWPTQVFNVMDFYGADADKEIQQTAGKGARMIDRTAAIQAALKKAEANGGGVVYFAPGKYAIQGEVKVPPRTILRGAGMGLVTLWWGKANFALDGGSDARRLEGEDTNIPPNLMSGTQFGLEDMSLYLPREYQTAITTGDGFQMHRVRIRIDRYWIRSGQRENETEFRLGNNCRVTDCDILSQGVIFSFMSGHDEIIARNKLLAGKSHFAFEHSDGMIAEDNDLVSLDPTAYINLSGEGRHLYYARNRHSSFFAEQSDFSWTLDGTGTAYFGTLAATNGTDLTLAKDPAYPAWAKEDAPLWHRAVVCIVEGKGTGQYRFVTGNKGRAWQIDHPFDVAPDNDSLVSIIPYKGQVLVVGNHFEDCGWVNMGYGSSFDLVCAHNSLYRVGEFLNLGLREPEGIGASWFIQYLNNDVYEGQTLEQTTGDQRNPQIFGGSTTRYAVHRNSHIHADNSGNINIGGNATDSLVEHCLVDNPRSAIVAEKDTAGILFRDNNFGPGAPARYSGGGLDKTTVVMTAP